MSEPIPHEIRVALAEAFTRILNARDPEAHWEPVLYDDESDAAEEVGATSEDVAD